MSTHERRGNDPLALALAKHRSGATDEATKLATELWTKRRDWRAAALLALIELDAQRLSAALEWTLRGTEVRPGNARLHLQAGRLQIQLGAADVAFASLQRALKLDPQLGAAWLELGRYHARRDNASAALDAFIKATEFPAQRNDAMQGLLDAMPAEPADVAPKSMVPPTAREPISIITCSVDNARYARASRNYARALADWPHELVRIADARSLADGYNRGLAAARGPVVIFSHDDVEFLTSDLGHRLIRHLQSCDMVGIAGASRVAGPAWSHAGHPWLHGCVICLAADKYEVNIFSPLAPLVTGLQVLDGVFLAMRRERALQLGWDADTFDGFHGYDVDFTLRAAKLGLKLGAATDLGLVHYSRGQFGDAWRVAARKLMLKHAELNGVPSGATHSFARVMDSRDQAMSVVDRLVARLGKS